jgi:ribosomal protein S18 acetylase RimI-like enzyme
LLEGEAIVGLVQIAAPEAGYALRTVARVPAYRGQGIGARLVGEALRLLRDRGAREVELSVEAGNDRALTLYRRFGFEVPRRTPVYALTLRSSGA